MPTTTGNQACAAAAAAPASAQMSRETRGRDSARLVKGISFLVILAGLGWICCQFNVEHPRFVRPALLLMVIGLIGFIVGRFME